MTRGPGFHAQGLRPVRGLYGLDGTELREPVVDEQEVGGERGELLCQIDTEGVQEAVRRRFAQSAFHCRASIHRIRTAFWRDVDDRRVARPTPSALDA
ncbi:hypothetical protein [Streptomyces sp. NPDC008121]|uniref:hypothetical protein n=1 Tax=Streptomyces sp. NPDC008121 TaxID=3364809 RepID=UPI0036E12210